MSNETTYNEDLYNQTSPGLGAAIAGGAYGGTTIGETQATSQVIENALRKHLLAAANTAANPPIVARAPEVRVTIRIAENGYILYHEQKVYLCPDMDEVSRRVVTVLAAHELENAR